MQVYNIYIYSIQPYEMRNGLRMKKVKAIIWNIASNPLWSFKLHLLFIPNLMIVT